MGEKAANAMVPVLMLRLYYFYMETFAFQVPTHARKKKERHLVRTSVPFPDALRISPIVVYQQNIPSLTYLFAHFLQIIRDGGDVIIEIENTSVSQSIPRAPTNPHTP